MAITKHTSTVVMLGLAALLCFALIAMLTVSATAQEVPTNETDIPPTDTPAAPTPTPEIGEQPVRIDSSITLHGAEYDGSSGIATLKIENTRDSKRSVTLTDAGAFSKAGEIPQKTMVLSPGEHVIEFPVTETDSGAAGVTIATSDVLYGVPLKKSTTLIGGPWSSKDVQVGAAMGALSVSILTISIVWRRLSGKDDKPERIA